VTEDEGVDRQGPVPATDPARPDYKGAPLDPERGPGLGCFWLQTAAFLVLFVLTPYGVINGWPAWLTTAMFIVTLILLLFVGQTVIFLLRLVAADRRTRRRPLRQGGSPTVGDLATQGAGAPEEEAGRPLDDPSARRDESVAEPDGSGGPPSVRQ
jgi:hypothetical protein